MLFDPALHQRAAGYRCGGECIVSYPRLWGSVSGIDHTVSDLYVRFLGGKVGNIQIRKPGRDDRES